MSSAAEDATLTAIVTGSVQGVGFRQFVFGRATGLGLRGWVGNLADGSVEVVAQGPCESLMALRDAVQRGPRFARVAQVNEDWSPRSDLPAQFEIR